MAGWPAVQWRTQWWTPSDASAMLSRGQRMRNRGEFRYAVPPSIADAVVALEPSLQEGARSATAMIERFDEAAGAWPVPFASVLLRSESASSSEIERLSASARRIALASLGATDNRNATTIARNVDAMQAAVGLADRMDAHAIRTMHAKLGGGDDPDNAGRFRQEWVWVGGASPVTADFVAPPHDDIPAAIDDLVAFLHRTDVEPLTQAALAHAQFETIHPFTDGNGRTGRALVSAVLRNRGVARNLAVPISSGLLSDTESYFAALTSYRQGDPGPIVASFAEAAELAVANASFLRDDVIAVRERVLSIARRRTPNIEALADLCCEEPGFTSAMVVKRGVTAPTAYRLCQRLVEAGILRRERSIRGVDAWTVVGLTDALDAFARRAGRRSFNR